MPIGDRIAARRKELNMTQDELAQKMGYKSKAAISKIETNVNDVAHSTLVQFAKALDTSVAYLVGADDDSLLDRANAVHPVLLPLVGLDNAERVQALIDDNQPDKAAELCRSLVIKSTLNPESSELAELLESLRGREDMRMLFKLAKDATPEDVRQAVRIIEALRRKD